MTIKTKFLTVRVEDVSGVGKNEQGDLFVVFKSGATKHVKYNNLQECDVDHKAISDALDATYGPKLVSDEPGD
jgi:hypothetical protein